MSGISVVIPAFNRAHLIGETLQSLLKQSVPADEIIVVDDGSTDETSEVVLQVANNWKHETGNLKPEVKIIRQENRGPATARNAGFAVSKGAFIHFFDSDDLAAPNKHEVQLKALQDSGADIAYAPWVKGKICEGKFTPENHVLQQRGLPNKVSGKNHDLIKALLTNWSVVPHACLFRRSIVEKVGGFPEHLFGTEDQMMFLNCLLAGARVVHSPGTLELYRTDDPSKITAVGEGQKRHVVNWARFLIDADKTCQKRGIHPREWFGFLGRAWEAGQDLKKFCIDAPELADKLKELKGEGYQDNMYSLVREINRKWLGLKLRITGGRAHASFCAAQLNDDQIRLIRELGLVLAR